MVNGNPVLQRLMQKQQPEVQEVGNPVLQRFAQKTQPQAGYSMAERGLQVARGNLGGIGAIADIVAHSIPQGTEAALQAKQGITNRLRENLVKPENRVPIQDTPIEPNKFQKIVEPLRHTNFQQQAHNAIDTLAGRNLEPTDLPGRIFHTTGEFLTPIPGIGAVKVGKGVGTFVKGMAKETPIAAGAATALQTPHLTEEGSLGRVGEDFVKVMVGAAGGKKLQGKAAETGKYASNLLKTDKYKNAFSNFGKGIMDMPEKIAGKALSTFAAPKENILKTAESHGIELPYNIALNHKVHNFLANNVLKSSFTADVFKKAYRDADEKMVQAVNDSINTLGSSKLKPTEASLKFKDMLKAEQEFSHGESKILYENAANYARPNDAVVPKHTAEAISSLREMTEDAFDPAAKKVTKVVDEMAKKFGLGNKDILEYTDDPKLLHELFQIFSEPGNLPAIPTQKLINIRKSLNRINYSDPEAQGIKAQLRTLGSALNKDIETTKNPEFLQEWRKANDYYRNTEKEIFQSDMAHAITTGEAPTLAFDYLNTPADVKEMERMMSRTPQGMQVFNDLKKAKVRQLLEGAIQGDLETGSLSSAMFAKKFKKNEKGQELLESLLGKQEYSKLSDIAEIAQEFSTSGRELLNTSGTAIAAHDIDTVKQLVKGSLGTLFGLGAAGLPGAAVGFGTPYVLSHIVSNPKVMSYAKQYALARKNGREREAQTILNRLIPMIEHEVKYVGIQQITNQENQQ